MHMAISVQIRQQSATAHTIARWEQKKSVLMECYVRTDLLLSKVFNKTISSGDIKRSQIMPIYIENNKAKNDN